MPTSKLYEHMNTQTLTLAYSPCPNDTYIMGAWSLGLLPSSPFAPSISLLDIAQLNEAARRAEYDVIKVSVAAYPLFHQHYRILPVGAALGKGIGPILVRRPSAPPRPRASDRILIPGEHTTAHGLLRAFFPECRHTEGMLFSDIMPSLQAGFAEYGVIIHEGQFTYAQYGLELTADLGQLWTAKHQLPIPLGAICARRDMPKADCLAVAQSIRDSIAFAQQDNPAIAGYIHQHAQEMEAEVLGQHIAAYVNAFSQDLGVEGERAIVELLEVGGASYPSRDYVFTEPA